MTRTINLEHKKKDTQKYIEKSSESICSHLSGYNNHDTDKYANETPSQLQKKKPLIKISHNIKTTERWS